MQPERRQKTHDIVFYDIVTRVREYSNHLIEFERTPRQRIAQMAKHEHGSMDTSSQEKTFDSFMNWVKWSAIVIIGILVFMAIFAR